MSTPRSYNQHRSHRALNLRPPGAAEDSPAAITDLATAEIRSGTALGGLISKYERAARPSLVDYDAAGHQGP